jgi:DNA invertase Pin-like site-specific DNA recombinase
MPDLIALGYRRVSSRDQVSGTGLGRQATQIKKFASENAFQLERIFTEKGISGVVEKRPAFSEMIAFADAHDIKIIIIEDMTRLARELLLQMQLATFIASKEIDLYSANTGENISRAIYDDPMRKAMVQMQGVFSELERSTLTRRMKAGRDHQRETGKRNGKPIKTVDRNGNIRIEGTPRLSEKQPKLARRVIELSKQGFSYYRMAKICNNEGFRSRTGGILHPTQMKNILRDYELGLINTSKTPSVAEYQDG